jgi:hypothetical protein
MQKLRKSFTVVEDFNPGLVQKEQYLIARSLMKSRGHNLQRYGLRRTMSEFTPPDPTGTEDSARFWDSEKRQILDDQYFVP